MSGVFLDANSGWHRKSETVLGFSSVQRIEVGGGGWMGEKTCFFNNPLYPHTHTLLQLKGTAAYTNSTVYFD